MAILSEQAIEDAIAGKLYPELILWGYCNGIFPMADDDGEILWFCPNFRGIIELDDFAIPRTLRAIVRSGKFRITADACFEDVIRGCADREKTWISDKIIECYIALYETGHAHSVEVWDRQGELAGGLYGVAIGGAFFGESMFHRQRDASKVGLVALISQLRRCGFALLDTQWLTKHLSRMGGTEIDRIEYFIRLHRAIEMECEFSIGENCKEIEIDRELFCKRSRFKDD